MAANWLVLGALSVSDGSSQHQQPWSAHMRWLCASPPCLCCHSVAVAKRSRALLKGSAGRALDRARHEGVDRVLSP
jgi:hypothetical protein